MEISTNIKADTFAAVGAPIEAPEENKDLRKAARMMERMFLNMLLGEMNKNVGRNSLIDGGMGEDMFRRELNTVYAEKIAGGRGIGIAKVCYDHMARQSRGNGKADNPAQGADACLRAEQSETSRNIVDYKEMFSVIG